MPLDSLSVEQGLSGEHFSSFCLQSPTCCIIVAELLGLCVILQLKKTIRCYHSSREWVSTRYLTMVFQISLSVQLCHLWFVLITCFSDGYYSDLKWKTKPTLFLTEDAVPPSGLQLQLQIFCSVGKVAVQCVWTHLSVCYSHESGPKAAKSWKIWAGESDAAALLNTGEQRGAAERIHT